LKLLGHRERSNERIPARHGPRSSGCAPASAPARVELVPRRRHDIRRRPLQQAPAPPASCRLRGAGAQATPSCSSGAAGRARRRRSDSLSSKCWPVCRALFVRSRSLGETAAALITRAVPDYGEYPHPPSSDRMSSLTAAAAPRGDGAAAVERRSSTATTGLPSRVVEATNTSSAASSCSSGQARSSAPAACSTSARVIEAKNVVVQRWSEDLLPCTKMELVGASSTRP